jgi:ubiquinone/menaquinone biosynthesis C-methylase UbiE
VSSDTELRERNRRAFDGRLAGIYDFYMQRERLSRLWGRLAWGSDVRHYYASMVTVGEVPDGGTIVDCPVGSGVALRALRPGQRVRYLGFDLSTGMLYRARREAVRRGLDQVELAAAEATDLPVEDGSADLFLSYFGLHCFPDPRAAIAEAVRCLRPGGRLVGASIVTGRRLVDRIRVRPNTGLLGPVGSESDLRRWLADAGVVDPKLDRRGLFAVFGGRV